MWSEIKQFPRDLRAPQAFVPTEQTTPGPSLPRPGTAPGKPSLGLPGLALVLGQMHQLYRQERTQAPGLCRLHAPVPQHSHLSGDRYPPSAVGSKITVSFVFAQGELKKPGMRMPVPIPGPYSSGHGLSDPLSSLFNPLGPKGGDFPSHSSWTTGPGGWYEPTLLLTSVSRPFSLSPL